MTEAEKLTPQNAYDARQDTIARLIDALPDPMQAFVLAHLGAVQQVDRQQGRALYYVLDFVRGVSLAVAQLLHVADPVPEPKVLDYRQRGSGV